MVVRRQGMQSPHHQLGKGRGGEGRGGGEGMVGPAGACLALSGTSMMKVKSRIVPARNCNHTHIQAGRQAAVRDGPT